MMDGGAHKAKAKTHAVRPGTRSGRTELVATVLALAAVGIGLVLWISKTRAADDGDRRVGTPEAASTQAPQDEGPAPAQRRVLTRAAAERAARAREPGLESALPDDGDLRFRGPAGSLRGHVESAGDGPFPRTWRLVLRPSQVLDGSEFALERELTFEAGEQDFVVPDLPLGAYDVHAAAAGFDAQTQPLLLERASPSPFVNLRIVPSGWLDGFVYDVNAIPLENIALTLESRTAEPRTFGARTDALGQYRFERVPAGPYRLIVGQPENPMHEPQSLRLTSSGMSFPTITLPVLGSLEVLVEDADGEPIPGAEVRGSGNDGGLIDGITDEEGTLVVQNLLPGRYRLRASAEGVGSRRAACEVRAEETGRVSLRLP